jgi:hypothetical protein
MMHQPLQNSLLTQNESSDTLNVRSNGAPTADLTPWLREYFMKRRQALLMEVAEIEQMLNLQPSRKLRTAADL